jgi:hypothetical protein
MRALGTIVLVLALGALAVGCTTTSEGAGYYRRGTIHSDSFPPGYSPGRNRGWGSRGF